MQPHVTPNAFSAQQTEEIWREIPGFDGRYEASDQGRIRAWYYRRGGKRQSDPRVITTWINNAGYASCKLQLGEKSISYFVHRLVMLAFIGPSDLTVNHKNGEKTDNRLCNLEYMTHADNVRHSFKQLGRQNAKGEKSIVSKLTDVQVEWLRKLANEGKSNRELIEIFNISPNHVSGLKLGKIR